MAQSSRQRRKARRRTEGGGGAKAPVQAPPGEPPPGRSETRNRAVRNSLEPLAPGQRPTVVTVAFVVVVILALTNVVMFLTGAGGPGLRPSTASFLVYEVVLGVMAFGLWRARYWAVLGLQTLLGLLIVVVAMTTLLRGTGWLSAVVGLGIVVPAGMLFFYLVKAMARIQMPERR